MKLTNIKINKKWFIRDFPRIAIKKLHHGTGRENTKNRLGCFDGDIRTSNKNERTRNS